VVAVLLSVIGVPLLAPFAIPMKTLEILNKTEYKEIFFIPKRFPLDSGFNFVLLAIKTVIYYIFINKSNYAYSNNFEQVVFVWSFLEIVACLYFNKRENDNK
jgi:hypothetical protein